MCDPAKNIHATGLSLFFVKNHLAVASLNHSDGNHNMMNIYIHVHIVSCNK